MTGPSINALAPVEFLRHADAEPRGVVCRHKSLPTSLHIGRQRCLGAFADDLDHAPLRAVGIALQRSRARGCLVNFMVKKLWYNAAATELGARIPHRAPSGLLQPNRVAMQMLLRELKQYDVLGTLAANIAPTKASVVIRSRWRCAKRRASRIGTALPGVRHC